MYNNTKNDIELEVAIQHLKMIVHGWGKRKDEPLTKEECEVLREFIEMSEE